VGTLSPIGLRTEEVASFAGPLSRHKFTRMTALAAEFVTERINSSHQRTNRRSGMRS